MTKKEQTIRTTRRTVQQCRWADLTQQTFTAYVEARTIRTTGRRLKWLHLPNRYRTEYRVVCDRTGQEIAPGMLTHESQLRVRDAMMRERMEVARWVQDYRESKEAEHRARKNGGRA